MSYLFVCTLFSHLATICVYVFLVLQHLTISDVYQNHIIYYKKTPDIILSLMLQYCRKKKPHLYLVFCLCISQLHISVLDISQIVFCITSLLITNYNNAVGINL